MPVDGPVRLDKWLWAARIFKTRALAAEAVNGGRVDVNGRRAKPSREVRVGDRLEVSTVPLRRVYVVRAIASHRRPAAEAQLLYEETEESRLAKDQFEAERRLAQVPRTERGGRPTKRDRRRFESQEESRRAKRLS